MNKQETLDLADTMDAYPWVEVLGFHSHSGDFSISARNRDNADAPPFVVASQRDWEERKTEVEMWEEWKDRHFMLRHQQQP
ncbi:MAG: hypothetical protein ACR2JC_11320 [Chloroflexota bacterium]|nr:MAG: hypothetical protein DLM70_01450 [Chloroflexota bacterium]